MSVLGPQKTNVICCKFPDVDYEPYPLSHVTDMVFGQYGDYMVANSYGQATIQPDHAINWLMMPRPLSTWAEPGKWFQSLLNPTHWTGVIPRGLMDDVRATVLSTYGWDMDRSRDPTIALNVAVLAGVDAKGESGMWAGATYFDMPTLIHEGGHTICLFKHGASWSHQPDLTRWWPPMPTDGGPTNDPQRLFADGANMTVNGDSLSGMGVSLGHYCATHKALAGWIAPERVKTVTSSQWVNLYNMEAPPYQTGFLELRVPLEGGVYYSLEKRNSGVYVHIAGVPLIGNTGANVYGVTDTFLILWRVPGPAVTPLKLPLGTAIIDPLRGINIKLMADSAGVSLIKFGLG